MGVVCASVVVGDGDDACVDVVECLVCGLEAAGVEDGPRFRGYSDFDVARVVSTESR